jgi:hypothetical protein
LERDPLPPPRIAVVGVAGVSKQFGRVRHGEPTEELIDDLKRSGALATGERTAECPFNPVPAEECADVVISPIRVRSIGP